MAVSIKHNFVSPITDEHNPGEVGPDEWNDDHLVTGLATVAETGAYSDLSGTPTLGTAAALDAGVSDGDVVVVQTGGKLPALDGSDLTNLPSGGGAVDSVNGQTGTVVLDPDDLDDTSTTHKFTTASDISKLAAIEANADVTDAVNVAAAGAFMKSSDNADDVTEGASNLFMTTSERSKLSGIEALADVTDAGNVGSSIHGATAKTSLVDNDEFALIDSAASNVLKRITWANVYAAIWSVLGAVIAGGTGKTTPVDADTLALSDSAASNATKKLTWANLKATLKTYFDTLYQATGSYQPLDSDLTTIAGLTATTDNFIQSKSSTWASRTPTQVTADLDAVVGDSGSGGMKGLVPAPTAGDAAANKYLKANGAWATVTASGSKAADQQVFTSSGTWTKPSGFSAKAYVLIECWGPGGGGCRSGSGFQCGAGGGAYKPRWVLLSSLGSTESVTIAAGGLGRTGSAGDGSDGGTTTFGAWVSAYGGKGGSTAPGPGGGLHAVGGNPGAFASVPDGLTESCGGDGANRSGTRAGNSVYGGGGGGTVNSTAGGTSQSASPGASAVAGVPSKPGFSGGGASSTSNNTNGGDGGDSKCVVTVFDGA